MRRRVAAFEAPVKKADGAGGFVDLLWKGVLLVEHKSRGKNLDRAFRQALDYFPGLKERDLPRVFGHVHPRYRTPIVAILFTAGVALALALSGTFAWLAIASAIARLVVYGASCGAAVALRRPGNAGRVGAAMFTSPLSPLLPVLGIAIAVLLVATASRVQLIGGAAALAAGALLFLASPRGRE